MHRTLRWLILSKETLTIPQLQEVLSIEEGDTSLQPRHKPNEHAIIRHCGSLIRKVHTSSGPVLEPAHFTVEEYLRGISTTNSDYVQYRIDSRPDNLEMAKICLSYLNFDDFSTLEQSDAPDYSVERLAKFPFREHAVRLWADYAQGQHNDDTWLEMAKRLLKPEGSTNFWTWLHDFIWITVNKHVWTTNPISKASSQSSSSLADSTASPLDSPSSVPLSTPIHRLWQEAMKGVNSLHCATFLRISTLVKSLLESGMDVNATSAIGCPLHCAILGPSAVEAVGRSDTQFRDRTLEDAALDTISVLLDNNVDVQQRYCREEGVYESTLGLMLLSNMETNISILCDGIKLLRRAGVRLNAPTAGLIKRYWPKWVREGEGTKLLKCFSRNDVEDSYLSLFMDYLRELNDPELFVHFGCLDARPGAYTDMDARQEMGSRLRLASQLNRSQVVETLLSTGEVDVDTADEADGSTALHIAARYQCLETARVLIACNADINAVDKTLRTPLHLCAHNQDAKIVELLLLHGADPYAEDIGQDTPWTIAASMNHPDVLEAWVVSHEPKDEDFIRHLEGVHSPLFVAASRGADECVKVLVSKPQYVNALDEKGCNLAHYCVKLQLKTLRALKLHGLDMALPDNRGMTPLHILARDWSRIPHVCTGNDSTADDRFKFLVREGCDVSSQCSEGNTPLHLLLATPQVGYYHEPFPPAALEMLMVDRNMNLCNSFNQTPLDCLIEGYWEQDDMVEYIDTLMLKGARFGPEQKPLTYVADKITSPESPRQGINAEAFLLKLLEIAPEARDVAQGPLGARLGLWASENNVPGVLRRLLDLGLNSTKSLATSSVSLLESVILDICPEDIYKEVLDSVNDIDLAAYIPLEGGNLLNLVCSSRSEADLQLARILIERGLTLEARAIVDWETPLMLAARNGKLDHMRLLLEHGADVEAVDESGYNVLQILVLLGPISALKVLVAFLQGTLPLGTPVRCGLQTKNLGYVWENDCELIHLAYNSVRKIQYLLEVMPSVDVNARTRNGETVLHLAALAGAEDTVELLIEKGANIEACNKRQQTPLHHATASNSLLTVKILCEKGADVDCKEKEGQTPLHIAAYYGYMEVVEYLLQAGASAIVEWQGLTPEFLAISENWPEIVRLFRQHSQTLEGMSFLLLLRRVSFQMFQTLIEVFSPASRQIATKGPCYFGPRIQNLSQSDRGSEIRSGIEVVEHRV